MSTTDPDGLPWDDEDRWPALLARIDQTAADLAVAVEHERRIWRARQPALRADPTILDQPPEDPDGELARLRGEAAGFARMARQLARLRMHVAEVTEDLADDARELERHRRAGGAA